VEVPKALYLTGSRKALMQNRTLCSLCRRLSLPIGSLFVLFGSAGGSSLLTCEDHAIRRTTARRCRRLGRRVEWGQIHLALPFFRLLQVQLRSQVQQSAQQESNKAHMTRDTWRFLRFWRPCCRTTLNRATSRCAARCRRLEKLVRLIIGLGLSKFGVIIGLGLY
jgi:hypothetical protein